MKPIILTCTTNQYGPTRTRKQRFVVEFNALGEPQIRRAMAPVLERDASATMHIEGVDVSLTVENV